MSAKTGNLHTFEDFHHVCVETTLVHQRVLLMPECIRNSVVNLAAFEVFVILGQTFFKGLVLAVWPPEKTLFYDQLPVAEAVSLATWMA